MTEVLNLFDEEPEPYGPVDRERLHNETRHLRKTQKIAAGSLMAEHQLTQPNHPLGAPPLDWWVIDG